MANLIVLAVHPPGLGAAGICGGFVLTPDSGDRAEIAFRHDWNEILDDDVDAALLNEMESTFVDIAAAYESTVEFVNHVETTYSNLIRSVDTDLLIPVKSI